MSLIRRTHVLSSSAMKKGGSGKSRVAMHIAFALMKLGRRVATIDLDARKKASRITSRTVAPGRAAAADLKTPSHICLDENDAATDDRAKALTEAVDKLAPDHDFIVIDTPGHDGPVSRLAHSLADTLITPMNDSFVDFDVLGAVDPETFGVTGTSQYAQMVAEARNQRQRRHQAATDWIVLRNRLSSLGSRNKRMVARATGVVAAA